MKNQALRKSKRFTIRLTTKENNDLRKHARQEKTSISNYVINCCKAVAGKSKNSKVKNLSKEDAKTLEYVVTRFYKDVTQYYHDYSNALDNLEHDNSLYNHDEIPMIDGSTIREALSAVKSNQKQLRAMRDELNKIEMSLYDN